jgi:hypothetical protein
LIEVSSGGATKLTSGGKFTNLLIHRSRFYSILISFPHLTHSDLFHLFLIFILILW